MKEHEKELQPRTITVLVKKEDDVLSSASLPGRHVVWCSDEPKERGGQDKGPSPLSYFLSSMGFCQFVHYAEHSVVENLNINSIEMKIDGKISLQRPRRFTDVTYEVEISSTESDEFIKKLARASADDCYVTNTLKLGCKVTGTIIHNGKKIDEHR
jgi:uncharacterized OsmC-like protein